jgi:hypothetical protein
MMGKNTEETMRAWSKIATTAAATCLSTVVAAATVNAAEVVLMTTGAVEQIMRDLIPSFERATGHRVTMTVLGTGGAVAAIKEGKFADLILLGPDALNELAAAGKVDPATIRPAFNSRIGLTVRAGAWKPDIGTLEALKNTLLDGKSIGYSIGPSGSDGRSKELPQIITASMPASLRIGWSVDPRNLSVPVGRYHSLSGGLIAGHKVVVRRLAVRADQALSDDMSCAGG